MEPFETDAVGLAARVREGELDPREVVEAAINRIESGNPTLNAVLHTRFQEARAEVARGLPDGPLRGVPVLIKDLGVDVAGLPATNASRLFAENVPSADSEIVGRYRRAGMVVLGTTNTSEFGKNASTEPALFGPTRNPWNHSHSPGGSSGGSAAAVASGMVPVAHGSDGGGSIRIPAAMCGLFGLKPTRGRVPTAPHPTSLANPLAVHHALTTTVRDSATLLDIAAEPYPGAPFGTAQRPHSYTAELDTPPETLRIGYTTTAGDGTRAAPEHAAAAERAAEACAALGHRVTEAKPEYDPVAVGSAFMTLMRATLVPTVEDRLAELGRPLRDDDLEPLTASMLESGRTMPAAELVRAMETIERVSWQLAKFFTDYDLLLTPTVAATTPTLGTLDTSNPQSLRDNAATYSAFTSVHNVTGQPAVSVPFGHDEHDLPLGVQLVAPHAAESLLLRISRQLERAAPWRTHAPRP